MTNVSEISSSLSHLDISSEISKGIEKYKSTSIHWHFMDISQNYFNDRIDWQNKGIELMDDKYFTLYNIENIPYLMLHESSVQDILEFGNTENLIVKDVVDYFKEVYIQKFYNSIISFLKWDKNPDKFASKISKINNIEDYNFIIVPTGKYNVCINKNGFEKSVISFAIINTNSKLLKYFKSGSSYKNIENKMKYNTSIMLNLVSGLTNHYSIKSFINLNNTSFNLSKAFIKHFQTNICQEDFVFRFNNSISDNISYNINENIIEKKVRLNHILQNMQTYFPKLQVIWNSLKYNEEQLLEILNNKEENYNFKDHDVLFKHLKDYRKDNDRQKRWTKRVYPYSKIIHINDKKRILERRRKTNLNKQPDKKVNHLTDTDFLKKLSMIEITTFDDL